jgi:hypothetical protein
LSSTLRPAIALLLAALPAAADPASEPGGPAADPPAIHAALDTTAAQVGSRLQLSLEVDEASGWLVEPPTEQLDLGTFRVRAVERIPVPAGQAFRLVVVPLAAGEQTLAVRLTAHGPEGRQEEVVAEIPVTVVSNLPAAAVGEEGESAEAAPEPADLKPALTAPRKWWPTIVAAVAFVLAVVLGFWLFRKLRARRRAPGEPETIARKPLRPAWEIALEELDRVAAANYVGRGELRRQYDEVTEALRRYLENRYGVPALESTTTELLDHLRRAPLASEVSARILSLLREADLVKFAKASPEPADARSTEARARRLVEETVPPAATREAA